MCFSMYLCFTWLIFLYFQYDIKIYEQYYILFSKIGSSATLLSVSNDRTFKIWSIDLLECLFESPQLGQYSLTCSAILESGSPIADCDGSRKKNSNKCKNSSILALGNCDGKVIFYDIDSEYEGKIINFVQCQNKSFLLKRKKWSKYIS